MKLVHDLLVTNIAEKFFIRTDQTSNILRYFWNEGNELLTVFFT